MPTVHTIPELFEAIPNESHRIIEYLNSLGIGGLIDGDFQEARVLAASGSINSTDVTVFANASSGPITITIPSAATFNTSLLHFRQTVQTGILFSMSYNPTSNADNPAYTRLTDDEMFADVHVSHFGALKTSPTIPVLKGNFPGSSLDSNVWTETSINGVGWDLV